MLSKKRRTAAALAYLHARFPAAFPVSTAALRPLAIGTREALCALLAADPEADAKAAGWALLRWCLRRTYLQAIAEGRPRVALDGSDAGAVEPAHREAAAARLAEQEAARAAAREAATQAQRDKRKQRKPGAAPKPAPAVEPMPLPVAAHAPVIATKRRPQPRAVEKPAAAPVVPSPALGDRPRLGLRKPKPAE